MWYDRWIELASPRIEGSIALLRALRAKGVPVFCLTNFGSYSYEEARDKLDFLGEFDREYVSGRLRVSKPDPRIYQAVEDDSGIAPDRLLLPTTRPTTSPPLPARGWRTHQFESWQGWAARLVAEGLLTTGEAGPMTEIVPKEAEALLSWQGLLKAFEAGHRLPLSDIKDMFLYRDRTRS
jgi:2-haloacid dehalogenase